MLFRSCALIETEQTALLIDAGLSCRQITQRLATLNCQLTDIDAILLTHNHGDHTSALPVICKTTNLPIYANRLTAEVVVEEGDFDPKVPIVWQLFTTGAPFVIGDFAVESFSVPHDALDPVGFTLQTSTHKIGFATDFGHATKLVKERLRNLDALVLESNHDEKLLQDDSRRSWALKQRIMSRQGHLSNTTAAEVIGEIISTRLQHIILVHLSRDCNRPELVQSVMKQKLHELGMPNVGTTIASQNQPTPSLAL